MRYLLPSIQFERSTIFLFNLFHATSLFLYPLKMSLLNWVPYVLTCQQALRAYVLTCQRTSSAYELTCQRVLHGYVVTCQRVLRAYVLTCLACLSTHVLKLQAIISNNKNDGNTRNGMGTRVRRINVGMREVRVKIQKTCGIRVAKQGITVEI